MSAAEFRARLRRLFASLKELGFKVVDDTGKKHRKFVITAPNGLSFTWTVSSTPSDIRAWQNSLVPLRRFIADAGYSDERKYLRVSTGLERADCAQLWDAIDALEAIAGEGGGV